MNETLKQPSRKSEEIREKIAALICLTAIAMVAMAQIDEPENIVINVVVAIAAFISGGGVRRGEVSKEG